MCVGWLRHVDTRLVAMRLCCSPVGWNANLVGLSHRLCCRTVSRRPKPVGRSSPGLPKKAVSLLLGGTSAINRCGGTDVAYV